MKISSDVLIVLSGLRVGSDYVGIDDQIDRALYVRVNKVIEALGGVWNRKRKAHVFPGDISPANKLDRAITTGEVATDQDIGHFPTPVKLATDLVARAGVKVGMICLEPSAGTGRIADAMLAVGAQVIACERDPRRREILGDRPRITVLGHDDFMSTGVMGVAFDRVVMNPPFCKVGLGDHLDHVRRAHSMLKPDGLLVSVLPAGVEFRRERRYQEFREWFTGHGGTTEKLPEGSFKESNTSVSTVVLSVPA